MRHGGARGGGRSREGWERAWAMVSCLALLTGGGCGDSEGVPSGPRLPEHKLPPPGQMSAPVPTSGPLASRFGTPPPPPVYVPTEPTPPAEPDPVAMVAAPAPKVERAADADHADQLIQAGAALDVDAERTPSPVVGADLRGVDLTDALAAHLAGCKELRTLNLSESTVTDAHLAKLTGLSHLTSLDLSVTKITDAALEEVARWGGLETLHLRQTAVTDAGVARLGELTNLTTLSLSNTMITDAGLPALAKLTKLATLDLSGTAVKPAAVQQLRQQLPNCTVIGPQ